jgi:hypothetical protein
MHVHMEAVYSCISSLTLSVTCLFTPGFFCHFQNPFCYSLLEMSGLCSFLPFEDRFLQYILRILFCETSLF